MNENETNSGTPFDNLANELEQLSKDSVLPLKPKPVNDGLKEDQSKALEILKEWAYRVYKMRSEQNFFALRGSAGTGKTTLIASFLSALQFPYRASRICICAPTHKAKKVLQQKTKWRNAETLQALLGLKMDTSLENFDPNSPEFQQLGERKMRDYEMIIVDESSMINSALYGTIVETAIQSGTKVLFVGDPKQLNPVKEYHISPSLITPINQYELTQIIRQEKDNPLIQVLDALRNDIEHGTATYLHLLKGTPSNFNDRGEGYAVLNDVDFSEKVKLGIKSDSFLEDKNFCRYISWTNDSISRTNKWVRKAVVEATNPTLQVGEILLAYKTVVDGDEIIITNSDDYEVQKIEESLISEYDVPINTLKVRLVGIDTGAVSNIHIVVREQENYTNYVALHKQQVDKAKRIGGRRGWGKFYEFKNSMLVLDNIFEGTNLLIKKDLDYGYGITIHKSQGSTYNTVFVNGKDINKNMTDVERKRLWYVAMSRASKIVYIHL